MQGPRGNTIYRLVSGLAARLAARNADADAVVAGTPSRAADYNAKILAAAAPIPTVTVTVAAVVAQANIGLAPAAQQTVIPIPAVVPAQQPQPAVGAFIPDTQEQPQQDGVSQPNTEEALLADGRRVQSLVPPPENEPGRQWPKPFPAVKLQCRWRGERKLLAYMPSDERKGRESLRGFCGGGGQIRYRSSQMIKMGTSQVYVCNTASTGKQGCDVDEYDYVSGLLDAYCGPGQPGNGWFPDWAKTYGRDRVGEDMCWGIAGQGR